MRHRSQRLLVAAAMIAATLAAAAAPASAHAGFGDVRPGRFYTEAVQWLVDNDITTGMTPECFAPARVVTRGQAAAFLWRLEGEPAPAAPHGFDDVPRWQQTPVAWMAERGITTGVTASTFEPERAITRGEFATLLWRLAGKPSGPPPPDFDDLRAGAFYEHAVEWMAAEAITRGTSPTTFSPGAIVARGEVATFLHRYRGSPPVVVDPTGAPCPIEYQPGVLLRVDEPPHCPVGGNPVVMTGGPNSVVFTDRFADKGYVHVDVDYRTPGYTGAFSAVTVRAFGWSIDDLGTAVRWVRAHADELCADPDRIAAVGWSCGGITALSLAYTAGELSTGDVVDVGALGVPVTVVEGTVPGPPPELAGYSPDIQAAVSFAGFALADTIDAGEPPSLLFHSPTDGTIPYSLAVDTCDAATAVGVTCELVTYDSGHEIAPIIDSGIEQIDAFLRRELG